MNTKLFLSNVECVLEEDAQIKPFVVECLPFVRSKLQAKSVFFKHPFLSSPDSKWPSKTHIACFHCSEFFDTPPVPSVRKYDEARCTFYVYGVFCSFACVKAHATEHEGGLSTTRLMWFTHMCRLIFGIHDTIAPAPPRVRLKRYGGDLTLEEFRSTNQYQVHRVLEPPFIQSSLLVESSSNHFGGPPSRDILDRRESQSMYDDFITREGPLALPAPPEPKKTKRPSPHPKQPEAKKPRNATTSKKRARLETSNFAPMFNLRKKAKST